MKKVIYIIVSVCALISITCHAQSGVETTDLSNMRAVMVVKQTQSGNLCKVDVRGKSSLTPDFVKPASVSTDLIESDIPYCDAEDTSELQAQAKQLYLENGYKQKTSPLLVAGIGCLAGVVVGGVFKSLLGTPSSVRVDARQPIGDSEEEPPPLDSEDMIALEEVKKLRKEIKALRAQVDARQPTGDSESEDMIALEELKELQTQGAGRSPKEALLFGGLWVSVAAGAAVGFATAQTLINAGGGPAGIIGFVTTFACTNGTTILLSGDPIEDV